jgi:hypothetical protein
MGRQLGDNGEIDVISTLPNRYSTFRVEAPPHEVKGNLNVHRILIPTHKSGFADQINSFKTYYREALKLIKGKKYDLVFASSSRLFTAYLGYRIAKKQNLPLYLDIRDIFTDTLEDVLRNRAVKASVLPVLRNLERRVFNYASHINLISAGFKSYFEKYKNPAYTYYPNGIDPEFLNMPASDHKPGTVKQITYAGNIGEGQGLHKIIPEAARQLGAGYHFLVVGDGGAKAKLEKEVERLALTNVEFRTPVNRKQLIDIYSQSDFLLIHLNDYEAFKKVLPSKVFELGAFDKPILAGVAGYANQFIKENLTNSILFVPGDADGLVDKMNSYVYATSTRSKFLQDFKRETVNKRISESVLSYLKQG